MPPIQKTASVKRRWPEFIKNHCHSLWKRVPFLRWTLPQSRLAPWQPPQSGSQGSFSMIHSGVRRKPYNRLSMDHGGSFGGAIRLSDAVNYPLAPPSPPVLGFLRW